MKIVDILKNPNRYTPQQIRTAQEDETKLLQELRHKISVLEEQQECEEEDANAFANIGRSIDELVRKCEFHENRLEKSRTIFKQAKASDRKESLNAIADNAEKLSQALADEILKKYEPAAQTLAMLAAAEFEISRYVDSANRMLADNGIARRIKHPMQRLVASGKQWKSISGHVGLPLTLDDLSAYEGFGGSPFAKHTGAAGRAFESLRKKALGLFVKKPLDVPGVSEDEIPRTLKDFIRGQQESTFLEAAE
jgi:hypothetical protein